MWLRSGRGTDAAAGAGEIVFTPPYMSYANHYILTTLSQLSRTARLFLHMILRWVTFSVWYPPWRNTRRKRYLFMIKTGR